MRDFYDVYVLTLTQRHNIDSDIFNKALQNTAEQRGNTLALSKADETIRMIEGSRVMYELWRQYQKNYSYAEDVTWEMVICAVKALCE